MIHRIDAELSAGTSFEVDPILATDGVDENLHYMLDLGNLPGWAQYEADGSTAVVEIDGGSVAWAMDLGRFKGASPNSGNTYDLPALRPLPGVENPTVTLWGSATDLDLWLWGRGPLDPIRVEGDSEIAHRIREAAAESTQ